MTAEKLVAIYNEGASTPHELVVRLLCLVEPGNPSAVLGFLPEHTLHFLRNFVETDRFGEMISVGGGPTPTPQQVDAAKNGSPASGRDHGTDRTEYQSHSQA